MSEQKKNDVNLEIQVDEETAQGQYANFAVVNHSDSEFVLDFVFIQPQVPKGKVRARAILAPRNAKRLLMVLQDNVGKYEQKFGPIDLGGSQQQPEEGYH